MPAETTASLLRESTKGSPFTAKEAAAVLDLPVPVTGIRLTRLASVGLLKRVERGRYVAEADQNEVLGDAIIEVRLHTKLDASELISLDLSQYKDKHLINIRRKGKTVTGQLPLGKSAHEALEQYLEIRGKAAGPLFQSPRGGRLTRPKFNEALNAIGLTLDWA